MNLCMNEPSTLFTGLHVVVAGIQSSHVAKHAENSIIDIMIQPIIK